MDGMVAITDGRTPLALMAGWLMPGPGIVGSPGVCTRTPAKLSVLESERASPRTRYLGTE